MELVDGRLGRIEDKLDKLTDAIIAIARAEQKLITLEKECNIILEHMEKINQRLSVIEARSNQNIGVARLLSPIWAVLLAFVVTATGAYLGFKK